MAANIEEIAGCQLALIVAIKLLLSSFRGNPQAIAALEDGLERMKADALASRASDRKLEAFDAIAESLIEVLSPKA